MKRMYTYLLALFVCLMGIVILQNLGNKEDSSTTIFSTEQRFDCDGYSKLLLTDTSSSTMSLIDRFLTECSQQNAVKIVESAITHYEEIKHYIMAGFLAISLEDLDRGRTLYAKSLVGISMKISIDVVEGGDLSIILKESKSGAIINRWAKPVQSYLSRTTLSSLHALGGDIRDDNPTYHLLAHIELVHFADSDIEESIYASGLEDPIKSKIPAIITIYVVRGSENKPLFKEEYKAQMTPPEMAMLVSGGLFTLFTDVVWPTL